MPFPIGKRLRIEVVKGYVVASTHDAAQRVAVGAGPFASGKEEQSLFAEHDLNAAFSLDATLVGLMLWGVEIYAYAQMDSVALAASPVRASKAYQAKRKEVDALREEMGKRNRARHQREEERITTLTTALGRTTLVVGRVGGAVEISGGQFFGPGGKRGLWDAIFAAIFAPSEKYHGAAYERLRRAEEELRVLEAAELHKDGVK